MWPVLPLRQCYPLNPRTQLLIATIYYLIISQLGMLPAKREKKEGKRGEGESRRKFSSLWRKNDENKQTSNDLQRQILPCASREICMEHIFFLFLLEGILQGLPPPLEPKSIRPPSPFPLIFSLYSLSLYKHISTLRIFIFIYIQFLISHERNSWVKGLCRLSPYISNAFPPFFMPHWRVEGFGGKDTWSLLVVKEELRLWLVRRLPMLELFVSTAYAEKGDDGKIGDKFVIIDKRKK